MKKSIAIMLTLVAVFISVAWLFEYPYRFGFLIAAVITATSALVLSLKKGKDNDS